MRILLMFLLLCLGAAAENSGPPVGTRLPAHHPQHITGPDAGTDVCPV